MKNEPENRDLPPFDLDAEQALLGSLILDPSLWPRISGVLNEEDFHSPAHQLIWTAISQIAGEGKPADHMLVLGRLKDDQLIDEIGGLGYFVELADSVPTAANAIYYAGLVQAKAIQRNVHLAGLELLRVASDDALAGRSPEQLLAEAEGVFQALRSSATTKNLATHSDLISAADLLSLSLPEHRWAVEHLVPEGLTILADSLRTLG